MEIINESILSNQEASTYIEFFLNKIQSRTKILLRPGWVRINNTLITWDGECKTMKVYTVETPEDQVMRIQEKLR